MSAAIRRRNRVLIPSLRVATGGDLRLRSPFRRVHIRNPAKSRGRLAGKVLAANFGKSPVDVGDCW